MIKSSRPVYALIMVLIVSLVLLGGCTQAQPTQTPAEKPYLEGKTLTIVVPNSPGGAHDTAARTLAPYIQKYSGAKNVLVENKKGGGGILGMNYVWGSKGDGQTVLLGSAVTNVLSAVAQAEGVEFDPAKETWLARVINKPAVLTLGKKSNINNADELKKMDRPFVYPAVGLDDDFYTMSVITKSLGLGYKVVTGFDGEGACQIAQVQGTVDGLFTAHAMADPLVKSGDTVPIMIMGTERVDWPGYENLPTVLEVIDPDSPERQALSDIINIYSLYESIWGPPNMDEAATKAWRDTLDKVMKDPEVLEKVKQIGGTPAYIPGEELQKQIGELMVTAAPLKATFDAAAEQIK